MPRASQGTTNTQSAYDLVVVGFGTAGLSLATSLADRDASANVLFLERKKQFSWQPALVLPENPVRTSFLRDLITTRNPRSEFTFVNYLHETNQLVQFTNSSHMEPTRMVMGNYLTWVAERIAERGWLSYSSEATRVSPVKGNQQQVAQWAIDMTKADGTSITIYTKRVVLATGSTPTIPPALASSQSTGRVLHSSACGPLMEDLKDQDIAIVGADQEAAEAFEHLQAAGALHRVRATMFVADSALRPEDNTSFIQDVVDDCSPNLRSTNLPPEVRSRFLTTESSTSTPRVSLRTIENLYEMQYAQRIHEPKPENWRFQIQTLSQVTAVQPTSNGKLRLAIKNTRTGEDSLSNREFDVVIAAGGKDHTVDLRLTAPITQSALLESATLTVDPEYRVNFRREVLAPGCGLWLLGSLQENKIRDSSISYMAERGERAVNSVMEALEQDKSEQKYGELAML